jgi:outer membrane lipoprotein SlyB
MSTPTILPAVCACRAAPHPLFAAAAVSVIVLSATGVASMTGLIGRPAAQPVAIATSAGSGAAAMATTAPRPATAVTKPAPQRPASQRPTPVAPVALAAPTTSGAPAEPIAVATAPQPATAPWTEAPRPVAQAEDPRSWATVESVRTVRTGADANGLGAVAGGVLGGVLGHQVGGGTGKKVATVVGTLGGGLLGHQVEQRVRGEVRHEAAVRLDDGSTRTFVREAAWSVQPGDRVRVIDGRLVDAEAAAPATRQVRYGAPPGG